MSYPRQTPKCLTVCWLVMKLMLGKVSTVAEASGCDWTKKACDLLAFNWLHEAAQKSPMLVSMATCASLG